MNAPWLNLSKTREKGSPLSLSLKATAAAAAATFEKADETFFDRQENGCLVADCVKRQEARRPQPTSGTCSYIWCQNRNEGVQEEQQINMHSKSKVYRERVEGGQKRPKSGKFTYWTFVAKTDLAPSSSSSFPNLPSSFASWAFFCKLNFRLLPKVRKEERKPHENVMSQKERQKNMDKFEL